MFGFGGNGFGRNGEALTRADLCQDFNFNDLQNGVRGILCDDFCAQNTTMLNGFNSIGKPFCTAELLLRDQSQHRLCSC